MEQRFLNVILLYIVFHLITISFTDKAIIEVTLLKWRKARAVYTTDNWLIRQPEAAMCTSTPYSI